MKIEFIEKEQDWQNEATRYWFKVDGEVFGIVDQADEHLKLLDDEGYPIEADASNNTHYELFERLKEEYSNYIKD